MRDSKTSLRRPKADAEATLRESLCENPWFFAGTQPAVEAPFPCPVTGYQCEGDLSYLCKTTAARARVGCRHVPMKIRWALPHVSFAQDFYRNSANAFRQNPDTEQSLWRCN